MRYLIFGDALDCFVATINHYKSHGLVRDFRPFELSIYQLLSAIYEFIVVANVKINRQKQAEIASFLREKIAVRVYRLVKKIKWWWVI